MREWGDGRGAQGDRLARGRGRRRGAARDIEARKRYARGDLRRFQRRLYQARHRVRRRRAHRVAVGLERGTPRERVASRRDARGPAAVAIARVPEHAAGGARRDVHAGSRTQRRPADFRVEAHQILDPAGARTQAAGRRGRRGRGARLSETAVAREERAVGPERHGRGRPLRRVPAVGQSRGSVGRRRG